MSQHGNGDVAERRDVHPRKTVLLVHHPGTYLPHAANLTLLRSPYSFLPILRRETEAQRYKVACISYSFRDQSLEYWCMPVISVQEQLREAGGLLPVGGQFGAYSEFQTSLNYRTRLCVKNKAMRKISRVQTGGVPARHPRQQSHQDKVPQAATPLPMHTSIKQLDTSDPSQTQAPRHIFMYQSLGPAQILGVYTITNIN